MVFETGVKLVARRGELMQAAATATPSSMVSIIGLDETKAAELAEAAAGEQVLTCANFNCPGQVVLSGHVEACKRAQEMDAAREARRAVSGPVVPDGAACPRCGSFNPPVAIHCILCGLQLKNVEVVHWAELLPGARESLPSVLYVVAVLLSFVIGGLVVALIGFWNRDLLQENWVLIGGFFLGAGAGLLGSFALIRSWVSRRSRPHTQRDAG